MFGCSIPGGSLRVVPLEEVDVFDVNTAAIHNGILWSLFLLLDYDQSMFCDLFTWEECASFMWHYLKGYPMFLVVFKDWDSNAS